jgi:putative membrane protein
MWRYRDTFPLTRLLYALIAVHGVILMVGGTYTYARVPLGFWMQEWFHFDRNNYDKIGHFAQGFVPAIVARELLIRRWQLQAPRLVSFLCVSICLAVSAFYELIEWWTALWLGQGADEFLGTQGDPWDTQSDMFFALLGAIAALVLLSRVHDRAMAALAGEGNQGGAPTSA